jgi:serine/threonine protein kinase
MEKLFTVQGIHVDPEDIAASCDRIYAAVSQGFEAATVPQPRSSGGSWTARGVVTEGNKMYAQAKEAWILGNFMLALRSFRDAFKSDSIASEKKLRAARFIDELELYCDECAANAHSQQTYMIDMRTQTVGKATAPTKPIAVPRPSVRPASLLARAGSTGTSLPTVPERSQNTSSSVGTLGSSSVSTAGGLSNVVEGGSFKSLLEMRFPTSMSERNSLVQQLKRDLSQALNIKAERIQVLDMECEGDASILVTLAFLPGRSDGVADEPDEEELTVRYYELLQDDASALYKGQVTMNLSKNLLVNQVHTAVHASPSSIFAPDLNEQDEVVLWQLGTERVSCHVEKLLGKGATATVYKVSYANKVRALKVYHDTSRLDHICAEIDVLLELNYPNQHPSVLQLDFVSLKESQNQVHFLHQCCMGGDLQQLVIHEQLLEVPREEGLKRIVQIAHQVARALEYCHGKGILHMDIKPENILLTSDGMPVLADFGVSSKGILASAGSRVVRAALKGCTINYASPWVRAVFLKLKGCSKKAAREKLQKDQENQVSDCDDAFAFGVTVLDMLAACGWRRGHCAADLFPIDRSPNLVDVGWAWALEPPPVLRSLLESCLDSSQLDANFESGRLMMAQIAQKLESVLRSSIFGSASGAASESSPMKQSSSNLTASRKQTIHNNLGLALHERGLENGATAHYKAAIAIAKGRDARASNNLGALLQAAGDIRGAKEHYNTALQIEPSHLEANNNLACVKATQDGRVANLPKLDRSGFEQALDGGCGDSIDGDSEDAAPPPLLYLEGQRVELVVGVADVFPDTPERNVRQTGVVVGSNATGASLGPSQQRFRLDTGADMVVDWSVADHHLIPSSTDFDLGNRVKSTEPDGTFRLGTIAALQLQLVLPNSKASSRHSLNRAANEMTDIEKFASQYTGMSIVSEQSAALSHRAITAQVAAAVKNRNIAATHPLLSTQYPFLKTNIVEAASGAGEEAKGQAPSLVIRLLITSHTAVMLEVSKIGILWDNESVATATSPKSTIEIAEEGSVQYAPQRKEHLHVYDHTKSNWAFVRVLDSREADSSDSLSDSTHYPRNPSAHQVQYSDGRISCIDLNCTNHKPALMSRRAHQKEERKYQLFITAKYSTFADSVTAERLDIRTQAVDLEVASSHLQEAPIDVLENILAARNAGRPSGFLPRKGIVILAEPASGKTTVMKRFALEALTLHVVPILITTVELTMNNAELFRSGLLDASDILDAYLKSKYTHGDTLTYIRQAVTERRILLLIDGMDECGTAQSLVEQFVLQCLDMRFSCVVTSRHTGMDVELFRSCCVIYRILPLGKEQQRKMVVSRLSDEKAADFMNTLDRQTDGVFKKLAQNVQILSMMISVFLRDGKFCSNRGALYGEVIAAMLGRLDDAKKYYGEMLPFFRKLALSSQRRSEQLRYFSEEEIQSWGYDGHIWQRLRQQIIAGALPMLEVSEQNKQDQFRFVQFTYQEYLAASEVVSEFTNGGSLSSVLGVKNPSSCFGIVKWHNVLLFCSQLLDLHEGDIEGFANQMFQNQSKLAIEGEIRTPGSESIAALLLHSGTVCSIDFSAADIGVDGAAFIADALRRNVLVSVVRFKEYDLPIDALKGPTGCPEEQDQIMCFALSSKRLCLEDAVVIGKLLAHNNYCTELDVSNNIQYGSPHGSEFVKHIAVALRTNTALVKISVANNEIGGDGAGHIADALQGTTSLTSLDVSSNNGPEDGFGRGIARALAGCSSLVDANLSNCRLSRADSLEERHACITALAAALEVHRYAHHVFNCI